MSIVYISKVNQDINEKVKNILEMMIIPEDLDSSYKYLLKPNLVNSMPANTGVTTDIRIIEAVIEWLIDKKINPENIILAEASLMHTDEVFKNLGIDLLKEKYGVKVVNIETENFIKVDSPTPLTMKSFSVPQIVIDCDIIINLPKFKTHDLTMLTLAMKNFFAFYPAPERKKAHILCIHDSIVEMYAWVNKNKKIYHIVDAITALEGKHGPINGNSVKLNLILASNDGVSLDITCSNLIDYPYQSIIHIDRAIKNNLGEHKEIKIKETFLDEIKNKFDMPLYVSAGKNKAKLIDRVFNLIFRGPLKINNEKCTRCFCCKEICPQKCIYEVNGKLKVDKKKCIKCYCCIEACEYKAVLFKVRFSLLRLILSKIRKILKF